MLKATDQKNKNLRQDRSAVEANIEDRGEGGSIRRSKTALGLYSSFTLRLRYPEHIILGVSTFRCCCNYLFPHVVGNTRSYKLGGDGASSGNEFLNLLDQNL